METQLLSDARVSFTELRFACALDHNAGDGIGMDSWALALCFEDSLSPCLRDMNVVRVVSKALKQIMFHGRAQMSLQAYAFNPSDRAQCQDKIRNQ